jgi:hypothetical protein
MNLNRINSKTNVLIKRSLLISKLSMVSILSKCSGPPARPYRYPAGSESPAAGEPLLSRSLFCFATHEMQQVHSKQRNSRQGRGRAGGPPRCGGDRAAVTVTVTVTVAALRVRLTGRLRVRVSDSASHNDPD